MHVLVCVDENRVDRVLDAARALLAPDTTWIIVHAVDPRAIDAAGRALGALPGRGGPGRAARGRLEQLETWDEAAVEARIQAWLRRTATPARLHIVRGEPGHEIVRAAFEESAEVVVLAVDRPPERRPRPLGAVARFVVDHVSCAVLLIPR